ncbi:hypothetical protein ACHAWU_003609 [Discostella pseudostelligera]|uniref:FYVE-type domain-containing protein n=1 Tax=Discostella pseudostelligera TaxID=259834 RepID=A0ABD3N2M9_9STRA
MFKVCSLCEPILLSKTVRVPISIVGGSCDQSSLGTISIDFRLKFNDVKDVQMHQDQPPLLHAAKKNRAAQNNAASTDERQTRRTLRTLCCEVRKRQITRGRRHNCTHCGRSVCGQCCIGSIHQHYFPSLNNEERSGRMMFKVCSLCEPILLSKTVRVPISIVGGSCDQSSLGTISM